MALIADVSVLATFDIASSHLLLTLNHQTIVTELTYACAILSGALLAKHDLLRCVVPRRLRVVEVASHDLISGHDDVSALAGMVSSTGDALIVECVLSVRLQHSLELLGPFQTDRFDKTVADATVGHMRCCSLLARTVGVS